MYHRNKGIIRDTGLYNIILFSIGIGLLFLSNCFLTYSNYSTCSLQFLSKHLGISLIISNFYIIINFGWFFGIKMKKSDEKELDKLYSYSNDECGISSSNFYRKLTLNYFDNDIYIPTDVPKEEVENRKKVFIQDINEESQENSIENEMILNMINKKKEKISKGVGEVYSYIKRKVFQNSNTNGSNSSLAFSQNQTNHLTQSDSQYQNVPYYNSDPDSQDDLQSQCYSQMNMNNNQYILLCSKNAHYLLINTLITYFLYLIMIIVIVISNIDHKKEEDMAIQSINGEWSYKCNLDKYDIFLNIIDIFFFLIILFRGKQIFNHVFIFISTKYIIYSSCVEIILGPLVNVFIYLFIYLFIF